MAPRWGLTVPLAGISLREHERVYREAEDLGYTDFWSSEADVDPWIPLALGAAWTTRATLGTAIVGAFTRGPAIIAMGAAAMGEAAPGRFVLGLGSGSNVTVERWNGVAFEKPLTRVTEVVQAVRQALDGEATNVQGRTLRVSGFRLGRPAPYRVPIYVAALRERALRVAARIADGVITNWLSPDNARRIAGIVREEERAAGKPPGSVEIVARLFTCPTDDLGRTRDAFRRHVTAYFNVPVYRKYQEWLGRGTLLREMHERWDAGDRRGALAAVSDEVLSEVAVIGTPAECRERLLAYAAAGVTVPVLALMNFAEPDERAAEALRMLRALPSPYRA